MNKRPVVWSALGAVALLGALGAAWIVSLPPAPAAGAAPAPIAQDEAAATVAALKPPKRPRPLVAVIGINDATEATLSPKGAPSNDERSDVSGGRGIGLARQGE